MTETIDRCLIIPLGVAVADWVRNTVMLTALAVWVVYIAVILARGDVPDVIIFGFPVTVYFALNPTLKKGTKDGPS